MKDFKELYQEWLDFKDGVIDDINDAEVTKKLKDKAGDIKDYFSKKVEDLTSDEKKDIEELEESMKKQLFNAYYNKVKPLMENASIATDEIKDEVNDLLEKAKNKVYNPEKMKEIWKKLKDKVK